MQVNIKPAVDTDTINKVPRYGTEGAAAFDFYSSDAKMLMPREAETFKTGWCFEVPEGHVMLVVPRSGLGFKGVRLSNCIGVIDSDYRGEVMVKLHNDTNNFFTVNQGDRIAQGFILPVEKVQFNVVGTLSDTTRGTKGLGSTGV